MVSFGRVRLNLPGVGHSIYLTFDDGPDPHRTPKVLELLERHGAKATFFLLGSRAQNYPDLVHKIHSAGHAIGNHSMSHPWFDKIPWSRQWQEICLADRVLETVDKRAQHSFRPPHGRLSIACLWFALARGLRTTLWSVDSHDYKLSGDEVEQRLLTANIRPGDVILFHDDGEAAIQALDRLIPVWKASGLHCAALPQ